MVDQAVLDKLQPWLLRHLHGTELPPEDLATYVVSLLQSDGGREELYERCVSELQEFMRDATEQFVSACFDQIDRIQRGESPSDEVSAPPRVQEAQGGQAEFRQNFRQLKNGGGIATGAPQFPGNAPFPVPFAPPQGQSFPNSPFNQLQQQSQMPPQQPQFQQNRQYGGHNNHNQHQNQNQRRQPRMSHLSSIQNDLNYANRRLIVEKVPDDKLNEDSVRDYFQRFGNLTNIRIDANNHLAEIEFEGHDQALAAHKSPDPIFDNRFVKVYWRRHLPEEPAPAIDVEAVRRMHAIKQQQIAEKEEKRRAIKDQIRELLATQAQLLDEKAKLLTGGAPAEALAEQQAKSSELSSRLAQLQAEAETLGVGNSGGSRGGFGGRGGYRGRGTFRGRGGPVSHNPYRGGGRSALAQASLDLRPKGVLVSGVDFSKEEALRTHLISFNPSSVERKGADSVLIDFPDRRSAETFFRSKLDDLGEVQKEWRRVDGASTMDET